MSQEASGVTPFLCAGRRARLHGDDATGPTAVQLAGRTVIGGLQAGLPPLREARAALHRHERQLGSLPSDASGGWTEVSTVDPSLPAATVEWEREGGETRVTLAFRLPGARRARALGRVLRIVHPDGDALIEVEAGSVAWRVATPPDGDRSPAVRLRAASNGRVALRVVSATDPEALRAVRRRLDRFAPAETRWRGDLADLDERGLRMPEGPAPVASALRWARARLRFADATPTDGEAPMGEWIVHLAYGASAAGEDEAARRFLDAAVEGGRPGPADPLQLGALLKALGIHAAWTGNLEWLGDRMAVLGPAIDTGVAGSGSVALARGLEDVARAWEPRCGARVANALRARARSLVGDETTGSAQRPPSPASTTGRSLPVLGATRGPPGDEDAAPPPTEVRHAAGPDTLDAVRARIRASPDATDPIGLPNLLSTYADRRGLLPDSTGSDPSRGAAVDAGAAIRQILEGWLVARPDAGYGRLELRPRLHRYAPPSSLMGLRIGDVRIDLTLARREDRGVRITMRPVAGRVPAQIVLAPVVPLAVVGAVTLDGAPVDVPRVAVEGGTRVELQFPLDGDRVLEIASGM